MKNVLKKLFIIIPILAMIIFIYLYKNNSIPILVTKQLDIEPVSAVITEYYIYGTHLNIKGTLELEDINYKEANIILYNGDIIKLDTTTSLEENTLNFVLSPYLNSGLYLDELSKDNYYLFLQIIDSNEDAKYYVLSNETDYEETTYYTMSQYNNKILINSKNGYSTLGLNITKNTQPEIYDITIDPGHGGMDTGANNGSYYESDYTMKVSLKVKEYLETAGYKVKLTHEEDELSSEEILDEYGETGRAVIPNQVKSKYTFSIHLNMNDYSYVNGLEIYTAKNLDYTLASAIATNIKNYTAISYSTNQTNKISSGVYSRNFTETEVKETIQEFKNKGYSPYKVSISSSYYYMIRETGGYMTGAYVDDRNLERVGENPYYNSNVGNESYLIELGYLSNYSDLKIITTSTTEFARAIADAIINNL